MPAFNYTGRVKIPKKNCEILLEEDQGRLVVTAGLKLEEYEFDQNALIRLLAYEGYTSEHFDLGTVGAQNEIRREPLQEFSSGHIAAVKFRALVIGEGGMLLGEADALRPIIPGEERKKSGKRSILPFVEDPNLGQRIWKLNLGDGIQPTVAINRDIGDWNAYAKETDFVAIAYPQIVREIASWVLVQELEEDSPGYEWVVFLKNLGFDPYDPESAPINNDDDGKRNEWLDDLSIAFANNNNFLDSVISLRRDEEMADLISEVDN
tara:strand:+ start:1252 stop:2046 length:795 start_codon:yes stop_codon:yes gene_type:complete